MSYADVMVLCPYRYSKNVMVKNSKNSKFNSASTSGPVPDNSASQSYLSSCDVSK